MKAKKPILIDTMHLSITIKSKEPSKQLLEDTIQRIQSEMHFIYNSRTFSRNQKKKTKTYRLKFKREKLGVIIENEKFDVFEIENERYLIK